MKKLLSITFVMMLFLASFSGCKEPEGLPNLIFSIDDIDEEGEYSPSWFSIPKAENKGDDEIDIHLILDAGMGMKGFTANRDSNYMKMVASLDSIFADMYINRNFNSYKLLNEIYILQDEENDWEPLREDYVKLLTVDYFHGARIGVDPAIWDPTNKGEFNQRNTDYMKIIEFIKEEDNTLFSSNRQKKSNDVFIFVSDFIPDKEENAALYNLTDQLYAKILCNGVGCAIVGIQSDFEGEMWGIEKEFFEFKGEMPFYFMIIGEIEEVEDIVNQIRIKAQKYKIYDGDIETLLIDTRYPYSSGSNSLFINSWENKDQLKSFNFRQIENDKLVSLEIVSDKYFDTITSYNFEQSTVKSDDTNILNGKASCNLGIGRYEGSNLEIESWDISFELKIIQGEEKYPDKNLKVFKEDDPKAFVPKDISMEKYDFVYSKSTGRTKDLDSIDEKNEIWKERTQIYDDTNGKSILVEDPEEIVQINKMHVENNILYIEYSVNPNEILEDMPYLVEIQITATPQICLCELDEWAENWTMQYECTEHEETEEAEEDEASEFLGCCTPDFIQSIEGLRGENMEQESFVRTYRFMVSKSQILSIDEE